MAKPDGPQFSFVVHRDNAFPRFGEEGDIPEETGSALESREDSNFMRLHPHVRHAVRNLTGFDVDDSFDVTAALHHPSGNLAGTLVTGAGDSQGEVHMIETAPQFRRQGVATSLLRHARSSGIPVQEDWRGSRTNEGEALVEGLKAKGLIPGS